MRLVVTGAAGFIGSHICERLVGDGHVVVGIDNFAPFYARELKEANLRALSSERAFCLVEAELGTNRLDPILRGADGVLHLAGRPGVRSNEMDAYLVDNVDATIVLVEAMRCADVPRLILASSSSVYAPAPGRTSELSAVHPVSPYARTKLAAEAVCLGSGIDTTALRYFTVYGPRQRPDMAFARFIAAAFARESAPLFGDGRQVRDFTYVEDAVEATVRALHRGRGGAIYNISGGRPVMLRDAIELLSSILGRPLALDPAPTLSLELLRTHADLAQVSAELDWAPSVALEDGLRRQVAAYATAAISPPVSTTPSVHTASSRPSRN